ncbi:hypothetical protein CDCA_CDCA02G0814 [Cyanidium caldarium]|uniref:Uncharacterized protein n=1 Tax=Cyanidium caldarium TaxID=2771 RepID=A0AAV9IRA5_CYACA|nr:hypothetical protein CDCA_CDCA02G0814 [Cyanidium caldarium]
MDSDEESQRRRRTMFVTGWSLTRRGTRGRCGKLVSRHLVRRSVAQGARTARAPTLVASVNLGETLPHLRIWLWGASALLGVLLPLAFWDDDGEGTETVDRTARECPACSGTGTIDCLCTRWEAPKASKRRASKAMARCDRCGGSGRERCPRCRGGGTLVHAGTPGMIKEAIPVRLEDGYRRGTTRELRGELL